MEENNKKRKKEGKNAPFSQVQLFDFQLWGGIGSIAKSTEMGMGTENAPIMIEERKSGCD